MIKRRLKSVTAPKRKRKTVITAEDRKRALERKKRYAKNRQKILKAAKLRRSRLTSSEKAFNKKRAEFLRKARHT
jgi:hypothetical protein